MIWRPSTFFLHDIEANTVLYFLGTSPLLGDNEKKIRLSKNVDNYEIEYHDSEFRP